MRKILIVSYLFAPNNAIGALRPTKIAKLLLDKGYLVDVVSAGYLGNDVLSFPKNINHWYPMNREMLKSNVSKRENNGKRHHFLKVPMSIRQTYRSYLARRKEKLFFAFFKQLFNAELVKNNYDVIFTSFGPLVSLECGLYVKKHCKEINWICDFRDPVITDITPVAFKGRWKWKEQNACKKANSIVAVSNGYIKRICGDKYISKRHMIPNGYDTADIAVSASCVLSTNTLHISYVGTLYEGKRKITPLFRALRELADEGKVDLNKLCFDYAGRDGSFLLAQANEFGLSSIVCDHNVLSRDECLKLQFSSHLLVLSTWNNRGEEGVFPGKFLEYMLIGRPIISLTDGNIPDSEVTSVMREGRFGIAYESVRDKEDRITLKKYIESCYCEWLQNGSISFEPEQEVLERYNYNNIIRQIEELIRE